MRESTKYNKIIGIANGLVYVLEETFKYSDDGLKGCCGYAMSTISQDYIDERNDVCWLCDNCDDIWREAVRAGQTTMGLEDFMDDWVRNCCELFPTDDSSYRSDFEQVLEDARPEVAKKVIEYFGADSEDFGAWNNECGGRTFHKDMEWDELFEPELWKMIRGCES